MKNIKQISPERLIHPTQNNRSQSYNHGLKDIAILQDFDLILKGPTKSLRDIHNPVKKRSQEYHYRIDSTEHVMPRY